MIESALWEIKEDSGELETLWLFARHWMIKFAQHSLYFDNDNLRYAYWVTWDDSHDTDDGRDMTPPNCLASHWGAPPALGWPLRTTGWTAADVLRFIALTVTARESQKSKEIQRFIRTCFCWGCFCLILRLVGSENICTVRWALKLYCNPVLRGFWSVSGCRLLCNTAFSWPSTARAQPSRPRRYL